MQVKIIKCTIPKGWYANLTGHIYEVKEHNRISYKYERVLPYFIKKDDCEIVSDDSNVRKFLYDKEKEKCTQSIDFVLSKIQTEFSNPEVINYYIYDGFTKEGIWFTSWTIYVDEDRKPHEISNGSIFFDFATEELDFIPNI